MYEYLFLRASDRGFHELEPQETFAAVFDRYQPPPLVPFGGLDERSSILLSPM